MEPITAKYTFSNQSILRDLQEEFAEKLFRTSSGVDKKIAAKTYFCSCLPGMKTIGSFVAERSVLTYGSQIANSMFDRIFPKPKQAPWYTFNGIKNFLLGSGEKIVVEALKLNYTPLIVAASAVPAGIAGGVMMGVIHQSILAVMNSSLTEVEKFQQLKKLEKMSANIFFTIDDQGEWRDSRGAPLSPEDKKNVLTSFKRHEIVTKILSFCNTIEKELDCNGTKEIRYDQFRSFTVPKLQKLVEEFVVKREDGKWMFLDGTFVSREHKELFDGLSVLIENNPNYRKDELVKFIDLIASKSICFDQFSSIDREDELNHSTPAAILPLFKGEENEWKNGIIRASDGQYVVIKETLSAKKGEIISKETMIQICSELQEEKESGLHADWQKLKDISELTEDSSGPNGAGWIESVVNSYDVPETSPEVLHEITKRDLFNNIFGFSDEENLILRG